MQGSNPLLSKEYIASAAIVRYRIVKPGTGEDEAAQATAVTEDYLGVCQNEVAAAGDQAEVDEVGITEVEYGGTVAYGDPLTSDSSGRAVAAAPAAGVNNKILGDARASGVIDDIGTVLLAPSTKQGA